MQKQPGSANSLRGLASLSLVLFALTFLPARCAAQTAGSETSRMQSAAADAMQRKIDFIKSNSAAKALTSARLSSCRPRSMLTSPSAV